jgi:hypothetical protein
MAKWKLVLNRKHIPPKAGPIETGPPLSAKGASKGGRGTSRFRYDTRLDNPQGWRSSFMSF